MNLTTLTLTLSSLLIGCAGGEGKQGPPGDTGAQGAQGVEGPAGEDGTPGADGEDGTPGADGEDGSPGADGEDGSPGADGEDGSPGADGEDGSPGADGEDGSPGADGEDGSPGADGEDAWCFGVDPLEFLDAGVTAAGPVIPGEEQSFTANLNDTGLEVDLAFLDLDVYAYSGGTSFSAAFAEDGTHSFVVIATDGCSIAMDTVSIEAITVAPPIVDSFLVHDGPPYSTAPPTYSCIEACAFIFGGDASSYECSTNPDEINNMAYHSIYGVGGCATVSDTYKNGSAYTFSGASSAYVTDNCTDATKPNYCFAY